MREKLEHMTKRTSDDLQLQLNSAVIYPNMTADSEAKKAKLDPSLLYQSYYANAGINAINTIAPSAAQLFTGAPLTQFKLSTLSQCTAPSSSTSAPKSRVVHVRNIPPDMVDVELMQLCLQYGAVSNYMMLKGKSQAFVEYEDELAAETFVNSMAAVPIQIRGRTVFAQFSTHRELKFDKTKSTCDSEVSHSSCTRRGPDQTQTSDE